MTPTMERDSLVARLEEIRARVEKTMCPTWSSDGGDQGEQGRISREDFDILTIAALSRPEQVVKALEWADGGVLASTSIGTYSICDMDDDGATWTYHEYPYGNASDPLPSVEAAKAAAQADYEQRILSALHPAPEAASTASAGEIHPDDLAVDRFAAAMKAKLARKRAEGRGGWEGATCNVGILSRLLREHVEKGDPLDVGNLSMMLHQRGERIAAPSPKGVSDGVREALEAARAHIITLGGNPHPHDQSADQIQVAVLAVINAALSQEPVPATAEERAASKEGA